MPVLQCGTCGGFGAPEVQESAPVKVDVSAVFTAPLALGSAPESQECPLCKTVQPVVGGKFKIHPSRRGNGACRGKVGQPVTDVEPEPAAVPARKAAARKAQSAPEPVAAEVEADDEVDVKLALQGGMSKMTAGKLATELRSVLSRKITSGRAFKGVRLSVFRDKAESKYVRVVVVSGAEGFDAAELAAEIERVAKTVRGIRNRMHKG
jgi:hypothetical protein